MAKLVVIGDSLSQGFKSLAICDTDLSYPVMIAEAMGLSSSDFTFPNFKGAGGLPLNIEDIARILEIKHNGHINNFNWLLALSDISTYADKVEDYYERNGKGALPIAPQLFHNLSVWGFTVGDSYQITAKLCKDRVNIDDGRGDNWFESAGEPRLRTAYKVLNPSHDDKLNDNNQIKIAKDIKARDGEIENLIVFLGANNCLGTVLDLKIRETDNNFEKRNLWPLSEFQKEYTELVNGILGIGANNVYVATIPYVTIPPITRGIMKNRGQLPSGENYFDYYSYFFVQDKDFDPDRDKHLTKANAKDIDNRIDGYNKIILKTAKANGWHVVDINKVLSNLASRRNHGKIKYKIPSEISDLNTRFFQIDLNGNITNGGLISLDGFHPTTSGYGIVAQEFINVMRNKGKVQNIKNIDFGKVRRWDSLVSKPPLTLYDAFGMLEFLEKRLHITQFMKGNKEDINTVPKFF